MTTRIAADVVLALSLVFSLLLEAYIKVRIVYSDELYVLINIAIFCFFLQNLVSFRHARKKLQNTLFRQQ